MQEILSNINPTIIAAIIGALIGSISTWILSYVVDKRKFDKKRNGLHIMLKSEVEINIKNLKNFKRIYMIKTSKEMHDDGNLNDINSFYNDLSKFPILSHDIWDKSIDFIPYVFNEDELGKIIQFNAMSDELSDQIKILSQKGMPKRNYSAFYIYELDFEDYEVTYWTYSRIENKIGNLIEYGSNIFL